MSARKVAESAANSLRIMLREHISLWDAPTHNTLEYEDTSEVEIMITNEELMVLLLCLGSIIWVYGFNMFM